MKSYGIASGDDAVRVHSAAAEAQNPPCFMDRSRVLTFQFSNKLRRFPSTFFFFNELRRILELAAASTSIHCTPVPGQGGKGGRSCGVGAQDSDFELLLS